MAGTNPVGTYAETASTGGGAMTSTAWLAQADANSAVLQRPGSNFAPQPAATPAMSVVVAAGFVARTGPSGQQAVTEVAAQTVVIASAPSPPNNRTDLIVIDSASGVASVVTGSPATTPGAPALPAGKMQVALVYVPNGTTAIGASLIFDFRSVWHAGVPGTPWSVGGGSGDAITATYTPANAALADGIMLAVRSPGANTSTTPTFAPDGLTAHTITKAGGQPMVAGDIPGVGAELLLRYDLSATRWELVNTTQNETLTESEIISALTYEPVQQGTGVGQTGNVIKIGWSSAAKIKATVDTTDMGNIALESWAAASFQPISPQSTITATSFSVPANPAGYLVIANGGSPMTITLPNPDLVAMGTKVEIVNLANNLGITLATAARSIYWFWDPTGSGTPRWSTQTGPNLPDWWAGAWGAAIFTAIPGTGWMGRLLTEQGIWSNPGGGGGDDGNGSPGSCFLAFALVTMADGGQKRIDQIRPGDFVMGAFGEPNEVLGLERPMLGNRPMHIFNGEHITTDDHPYWTTTGPAALIPANLAHDWGHPHDVIVAGGAIERRLNVGLDRPVRQLLVGDTVYRHGQPHVLDRIEEAAANPGIQLYNLVLAGSHTYRVDGYTVTGWPREDDFDYDRWRAVPAA